MTSKHTPGPWSRNIPPISRYPTIFAGRNTHIAAIKSGAIPESEAEANAALIVAAPELLAALEDFFAMIQGEFPSILEDSHHFDKITAAIAKAKGAA